MTHPPPGPAGQLPGPRPRRRGSLLLLSLVLGAVVVLLAVATVANLRAQEPGLFEPSLEERLAEPDQHGVSKLQHTDSAVAANDSRASFRAFADASNQYYLALTASGEASLSGGADLLAGLDQAKTTVDAVPALADPEVAQLKTGYDEAFVGYREEVVALVEESEALSGAASCHPSQFGGLDPAGASTLELVQECQGVLTGLGEGRSPLARVTGDSAIYLGYWADAIEADDPDRANEARSQYQQVYLGAVQVAQGGVLQVHAPVSAEASDLNTYCDRAADLPAGS